MEHLPLIFPFLREVWDLVFDLFRTKDLNQEDPLAMIEHCPNNYFKNPIVNRTWSLILGFILWNVWKERKKAIFQDQTSSSASTWGLVKENKRETIMLERCDLDDWKANLHETTIIVSLKLAQNMSIP